MEKICNHSYKNLKIKSNWTKSAQTIIKNIWNAMIDTDPWMDTPTYVRENVEQKVSLHVSEEKVD